MDKLFTVLLVLIVLLVMAFSYNLRQESILESCDTLNAFYVGDKVYKCERLK
jgi:hypothetical protein